MGESTDPCTAGVGWLGWDGGIVDWGADVVATGLSAGGDGIGGEGWVGGFLGRLFRLAEERSGRTTAESGRGSVGERTAEGG